MEPWLELLMVISQLTSMHNRTASYDLAIMLRDDMKLLIILGNPFCKGLMIGELAIINNLQERRKWHGESSLHVATSIGEQR